MGAPEDSRTGRAMFLLSRARDIRMVKDMLDFIYARRLPKSLIPLVDLAGDPDARGVSMKLVGAIEFGIAAPIPQLLSGLRLNHQRVLSEPTRTVPWQIQLRQGIKESRALARIVTMEGNDFVILPGRPKNFVSKLSRMIRKYREESRREANAFQERMCREAKAREERQKRERQ